MTHHELLSLLDTLPNLSDNKDGMSVDDRLWLANFRLRFASGEVPSVADEDRLVQIADHWSKE